MNVYIIEDNPFFRKKLTATINQLINESNHVYHLENEIVTSKDLLQQDLSDGPHLYFLDIELLERYNGIDLGREIRKTDVDGYIVYITSLEDKLVTIIDEHIAPLGFITKNLDEERLIENIKRSFQKVNEREVLRNNNEYYTLSRAGKQMMIAYKDILYFEKVPRSKKVVLRTNTGMYTVNQYLSSIKDDLDESHFIFLNSFIIHGYAIQTMDAKGDVITFKNGSDLFVGKHTFRKIKSQYVAFKDRE